VRRTFVYMQGNQATSKARYDDFASTRFWTSESVEGLSLSLLALLLHRALDSAATLQISLLHNG
jgi:hypothetical protein